MATPAYGLRLSRQRWDDIEVDGMSRPAAIVIGAWILLAWARFGTQTFVGPREFIRFVLVGVYGWLGLTVVLWALSWWRGRAASPAAGSDPGVTRMMAKIGQAHQPLVVGGLTLQFLQVAPHSVLNTVIAVLLTTWMGAQMVAAVASAERRTLASVAVPTVAVWLLWLATAGRFLQMRLGHLV